MKHPFRQFADDTRAEERAVDRVHERLAPWIADPTRVRERLAALPDVPDGAEERILRRVAHLRPEVPNRRRPALLGGLLAAAALLWYVQPVPTPLDSALSAPEWRQEKPTDEVALAFQGEGTLGGDSQAPKIDWRAGTLQVEVQPNRGIKLSVETREALVKVVGTGFSVDRSALGTAVVVTHGRVSVDCAGGEHVMLGAGEREICLPTTPAALLGRARALGASGAPADEILQTTRLGLAAGPQGAVREELEVATMETLAGAGRLAEARQEADAALAAGPVGRRADILHLRARYALAQGGCASGAELLVGLRDAGLASPVELDALAACAAD